jgi:hypothetical protein
LSDVNEGGVNTGFSALDSILLIWGYFFI